MTSTRPALLVVALVLAACARNPVTGKRQLALISEQQEIELGKQSAQEVAASMGFVKDEKVQAYVSRLGHELAARSERPKLPWTFKVVDDPTPNAFALPGGFIYVTRGLMTVLNSEAELAMVLGHEIGHVTARHSVSQLSKAQLAQVGLGLGVILVPGAANYGQLAGAGLQLLFLKYGRDDESQADRLGFRYAANDRYDMHEAVSVMETLARISKAGGGGNTPDWLQTHPNPDNRYEELSDLAKKHPGMPGARAGRNELLAVVNGLAYGQDPRQGFVVNDKLFLPDLHVQIDFPEGWKIVNQPQAVIAMSPQQDAAIQVTLAEGGSPSQAAQKFATQQGVQAKPWTGPCGGDLGAGTCLAFQAQSNQGPVTGVAGFVEHGGKVFAVAAFAPPQAAQARSAELQSALTAIHDMHDPKVLAVRPAKVEVVTVGEPMTLEQFNGKYPSTIPLSELAIANGMQPQDTLRPGELVKRVTGGTRVKESAAF